MEDGAAAHTHTHTAFRAEQRSEEGEAAARGENLDKVMLHTERAEYV